MEPKEIKMLKKAVKSSDGKHTLRGRVYLPEGSPKGLFHVVHGMTEHIARYDSFMREIAAAGYVCFGYDNLGHGYTVKDESELGYIAEENGDKLLVSDVKLFGAEMKKEYGETLPYILLGHSMGSFIVRNVASTYPGFPDKLIIMGTGGPNPVSVAGLRIIKSQIWLHGDRAVSPMINKLIFGSYNKKFGKDDRYNWLSKLKETRDNYRSDWLCTFSFTLSAMKDLVKLQMDCNAKKWFGSVSSNLPILLVSGLDDPVGSYGKGVKTVYDKLKAAGKKATLKLYKDCRHEILNDTCRDRVINDILTFTDK